MATTNFGVNNALTNKLWGQKAFKDAVKPTLFGKLMGKSDRSIVQVKDDLQKSAGDRIRFRLRSLPQGPGVEGNATLEGKEEGLEFGYFDIAIDNMRHATKVDLSISQQRVNFDLRSEAKEAQNEWWQERLDDHFIRYLSGDTTLSFAGNVGTAPTAERLNYGGIATAKNDVLVTDVMDLAAIDRLVEKAKLSTPYMRKSSFSGKNLWVLIMHPFQVHDLRTNINTGQWLDIQKAAMQGGKVSDNPIWSEALGVYHDVLLIESTRIPTFSDYGAGANIDAARALFLGAQAGVCAFGKGHSATSMKWTEKLFDYGDKFGVATACIWGVQKTVFQSSPLTEDFATIALDTAATSHS